MTRRRQTEHALRREVSSASKRLWTRGWVANHDGNITARLENGNLLATPTGLSKRVIDADMLPDSVDFLSKYIGLTEQQKTPAVIAGGFSLKQVKPGANQKLHAAQAKRSDCIPANRRALDPGRFVFSSNIVVHKQVLRTVEFDEQFSGWGWEDVDWGLRVAHVFPILHVENTATHLGLEPDDVLIRKFGSSGPNYARLVHNHPTATRRMKLTFMSGMMRNWPFVAGASRMVALHRNLPLPVRLFALKLYRARMYANHL